MNEIAPPIAPVEPSPPPLPARERYSSLTTYEACPRRYAYRYVEHLPGEVPAGWFTFGSTRLGLHFAEPGFTIWTTRSADVLSVFGEQLSGTVRAIRRREFAARPGSACRWCEYRATCPDVAPSPRA